MLDGLRSLLEGRHPEQRPLVALLDDHQRRAVAEVVRFLLRLEDEDPINALGGMSPSAVERWMAGPPAGRIDP